MIKPVAMGPNEVEDASREFDLGVQIESPSPDQKSYSNRGLRLLRLARGGHREVTDFLASDPRLDCMLMSQRGIDV